MLNSFIMENVLLMYRGDCFHLQYYYMMRTFIFSFLVLSVYSMCEADHSIEGFETGQISLYPPSNGNLFVSNFKRPFMKEPSIAIGILDLSFQLGDYQTLKIEVNFVSLTNVRFSVSPGFGGSWNSIRINFWASHRSDVVLGGGSVEMGMLSGTSAIRTMSISNVPSYQTAIARPLLNGFTLAQGSSYLDIKIEEKQIKQNSISILITAGGLTNIKTVWLSYIVFNPSTARFTAYGGLISEMNFKGATASNIHTIIHYTENFISGLSRLKSDLDQQFSFSSSIDQNLVMEYSNEGSPIDFFLTYLVLGNPPGKLCAMCSQKFALDGKCVRSCPLDTYSFTYPDRGTGCRRCSSKLSEMLNPQRTGCMKGQQPPNSFVPPNIPNTPGSTSPAATSPPVPTNQQSADSCKLKEHSYWTGYRCACKVGYKEDRELGVCKKIVLKLIKKTIGGGCGLFSYSDGKQCLCIPGYEKNLKGICQKKKIPTCPPNSLYVNNACVCNEGYKKIGDLCRPDPTCPVNQVPDGNGGCKCKDGYYFDATTQTCVLGQPCPPNSMRNNFGFCECDEGYVQNPAGLCVRCLDGKFWNGNECIHVCGTHQVYNSITKRCECKTGFGFLNDVCVQCTGDYFLRNGFCVRCPIDSVYDPDSNECVCEVGFVLVLGFCSERCGTNQVFIVSEQRCRCFQGLGRVNGECQPCPSGNQPDPITQECGNCGVNQIFSNGECVCAPGFGLNRVAQCIICEDQNFLLIDGVCGLCINNREWDGTACVCSAGTVEINGECSQQCQQNQLVDLNGLCYYCPINEVPVGNQCQCIPGYTRIQNGRCQRQCSPNQFIINGVCGVCVLNSVYDPTLQACVCDDGFYRNNFGICVVRTPSTNCPAGQYFSETQSTCLDCGEGCATCQNQNLCFTCQTEGFQPLRGECVPECGDGRIIVGQEGCDDGNDDSGDGCSSSCQVEPNYSCQGEPSFCMITNMPTPTPACGNGQINAQEECDDGNVNNGDGCSSSCMEEDGFDCDDGTPTTCTPKTSENLALVQKFNNAQAIYVTVQTPVAFIFNSDDEMKQLFKYEFSDNALPTSAYCMQKPSKRQDYDCIYLYASGVPNFPFNIELSYSKDGLDGYLEVPIDTSQSMYSTRSLI